jgi:hypothetical protein
MLFAHLKRILKLDRLRLRGPDGGKDEFLLAAAAQILRKMAKLRQAWSRCHGRLRLPSLAQPRHTQTSASVKSGLRQHNPPVADTKRGAMAESAKEVAGLKLEPRLLISPQAA